VNAPGTIDAGYRGEVKVILLNTDPAEPFAVRRGDRIAQLVVQPVVSARFLLVQELPPLGSGRAGTRGGGGFGSTGGFGAAR
ncbi:MAG TPA: dUTP diphosphatase, partial [Actinomycetota bacterium]